MEVYGLHPAVIKPRKREDIVVIIVYPLVVFNHLLKYLTAFTTKAGCGLLTARLTLAIALLI